MARKRDAIQIQTEVTTQEEWEQEIARPGLTVVDVYPDWCGPCSSMVGTLKKIKFELGDDLLSFVTARSDDIAALESFRNRCEPLWVFFGSGQPVLQMRGAHSPLLARKIVEELEKEKKAMAGERDRVPIPLVCDAPAEVQLPPAAAAAATEDDTETAEALNARRMRSELRVRRALAPYGMLVVGPAAADRRDEILALLQSRGFIVAMETLKTLTAEEVKALVAPPPPPPPPPPPAPEGETGGGQDSPATTESGADGATGGGPEGATGGEPAGTAAGKAEDTGGAEGDPEAEARRQATKEKLLEGECAVIALKDSEFSEEKPYRWLTLYLGRAPAPPPGVDTHTEVPPPAAGVQHDADAPAAEAAAADAAPEPTEGGATAEEPPEPEPEPEPEPALTDQLRELLGEEAAAAVFSPETVTGQWAALRRHFPELHRAPPPPPPPAGRQVAFVVFPGEREEAAQQLTEAGFTVLHSGVNQLSEEVAGQLVARLEGGDSQVPELVAAPVLAAAVASDRGAALAAIANLDPLYLSDSPDQADRDAQQVFASWGVEIPSLRTTAGDGGTEGAAGGTEGAAVNGEGAAGGPEDGSGEAPAEETAAPGGVSDGGATGEEVHTTGEAAAER